MNDGNANYILKHKDIDVLKFRFNENSEISEVTEILSEKHLPVGVLKNENTSINKAMSSWWEHRRIPASRDKLETGLKLLNISAPLELLRKSMGLSLNDHYWIMPENSSLKWHKINYYENDFSEDIGKALFDNKITVKDKFRINVFSPDNSSDGVLKKKWIIKKNGTRALLKGGDIYSPQDAFNEVIAAEIMSRLKIPHAEYRIIYDKQNQTYCSESPNFTTEKTEFINANHIMQTFSEAGNPDQYENFVLCCEKLGIRRNLFEKDLVHMFLVDFIMANRDRHYRNFGFLRNSETLEWEGLAPVYDTGRSLFEGLADIDLENRFFTESKNIEAKPFAENQSAQIKMLPLDKFCAELDFRKLDDISEWTFSLLESNIRLSENRKKLIAERLGERIIESENEIQYRKSTVPPKKNPLIKNPANRL